MNQKVININSEILGGTPVFAGTRVPISTLFNWLETETLSDFLENFPSVSREQVLRVLQLAQKSVTDKRFLDEATA